jgi:extracellular elastinolytic metalloproteinase
VQAQLGKNRRRRLSLLGATALGLIMAATVLPASGQSPSEPDLDGVSFSFQGEDGDGAAIVDSREGSVAPTAAQEAAAEALGATAARWNRFGTPHVLFNQDGYLSGPRAGDAADVARGFVLDHRGLFRMSEASVAALEVVGDSPLLDSPDLARSRNGKPVANPDVAHVVTFRQTFGDLAAAHDGLLTVGVQRDGRVAWVSSSVTGDESVSGTRSLDAA